MINKLWKEKVMLGEIKKGDSIMADKGFDIHNNLKRLDLKLNIPPYLKDKVGFEEDDVTKTDRGKAQNSCGKGYL